MKLRAAVLITFAFISLVCIAETNPWNLVKKPTSTPSESIGEYMAGCLRGAQAIPLDGPAYQTMRPSRWRFFGHPALIEFILRYTEATKKVTGQNVLIGDVGQPRGGPTLSGHASHQSGLDMDIWFWQPEPGRIITPSEKEKLSAPSMVIPEFEGLSGNWNWSKADMLREAANIESVERIFVNPVIKKAICLKYKNQDWIRKLRPWWFHEEHFHVRLHCQPQDIHCVKQAPVAEGTGCGAELDSWFTADSKAKSKYMRTHSTPATMPQLPALCQQVLVEP